MKIKIKKKKKFKGYTRYFLKVKGEEIIADYNPDWMKTGTTIHIEFLGVKGEKNPISETGYRSHFITGTGEKIKNVKAELQKLADKLADEEQIRRAKEQRRKKREKNLSTEE